MEDESYDFVNLDLVESVEFEKWRKFSDNFSATYHFNSGRRKTLEFKDEAEFYKALEEFRERFGDRFPITLKR